jgi:serine-type D-Ala-D-Ala carboxypeptidase (penicillin-binding protein 5/6)
VRGRRKSVTVVPVSVPREVSGPLARGQRLGEAEVRQDGRRVATIPLVAAAAVPEAGVAERTKTWFTRPPVVVLAFAVLGGTVLLARRRRIPRLRRRRARDGATA